MNQKIEFVLKALKTDNFRELCREYEISAKTGYKWKERFLAFGIGGMGEESRRPKTNPGALPEATVCEIVSIKQAHPHWGPEKIRAVYERKHPLGDVPSLSSFQRVLGRAGLVKARRVRPARGGGRVHTGLVAGAPNEVWTVDFKGWWRDPEGKRCEPLTVRDEHSRYLLCLERTADGKTGTVRASFERLFGRYGLPGAIRSDNGAPFASSAAPLGLSRLSAWWVALGIGLERSRPGCPQDNGAHERMHLDIQRELSSGGGTQAAFDVWRQEFNRERPHRALGNLLPADAYQKSSRKFAGTPEEIDYGGLETRRVQRSGMIRIAGDNVFISQSLEGWTVGLKHAERSIDTDIYFAGLRLGHYHPPTASFERAGTGPLERGGNTQPHSTKP